MVKRKTISAVGGKPGGGLKYSREEVARLKDIFDKCDKDGSGEVSLSEIIENLSTSSKVGGQGTSFRVADLADSTFRQLDKDGSGFVSFSEYLLLYYPNATKEERAILTGWVYPEKVEKKAPEKVLSPEQIREISDIFRLYDLNGDGVLSRAELVQALGASGYDEEEVEDIFEANAKGKSHLTLEDFTAIMAGSYL